MAPYWIILISFPLAVAGQFWGLVIGLGLAAWGGRRDQTIPLSEALDKTRFHWIPAVIFVALRGISGFASMDQFYQDVIEPVWGLVPWVITPTLLVKTLGNTWSQRRLEVFRIGSIVILIWGGIALSQILWPWKLSSIGIVADVGRSRGWYSHPLTLAYAALWLLPWSVILGLTRFKLRTVQGLGLGVALLILCSMSRIVQLIAVVFFLIAVARLLSRRQALGAVLGGVLFVSSLLITDNPISHRIHQSARGEIDERGSGYADDRLAFWHVHWLMFLDHPVLGHGGNKVGTSERLPYYERIGLGDFKKPFEAHNELLQILVEQGMVGLVAWLVWLTNLIRYVYLSFSGVSRFAWISTIIAMLVGGLSQNWFHDSEVRFGLILAITMIILEANRAKSIMGKDRQTALK